MTDASQQRSLRQLIGPVGADYQRRALPPGWVWAVLAVLLAATAKRWWPWMHGLARAPAPESEVVLSPAQEFDE